MGGETGPHEGSGGGHNRTRSIQSAHGRADCLLTLDADHVLRQDAPLPALTATSGDHRAAVRSCDTLLALLALPDVPAPIREQTLVNREYGAERLAAVPRRRLPAGDGPRRATSARK